MLPDSFDRHDTRQGLARTANIHFRDSRELPLLALTRPTRSLNGYSCPQGSLSGRDRERKSSKRSTCAHQARTVGLRAGAAVHRGASRAGQAKGLRHQMRLQLSMFGPQLESPEPRHGAGSSPCMLSLGLPHRWPWRRRHGRGAATDRRWSQARRDARSHSPRQLQQQRKRVARGPGGTQACALRYSQDPVRSRAARNSPSQPPAAAKIASSASPASERPQR